MRYLFIFILMQFVFCNISCKYSSSQDIGEIDKILNQIDYSSKAKFFADFDEYKMKGLEELVKTELQVPFIVIDSINNSKILYLVSSIDHVCRIEYEYREDYLVKHKIEKDLDTFIHEYTLHDYEKKYTFIYVSDSKKSLNNAYLLELEINSKESGYGYIFNNKAFFLPPQILSKDFSPDKEYIFSYIDIVKKKSNERCRSGKGSVYERT